MTPTPRSFNDNPTPQDKLAVGCCWVIGIIAAVFVSDFLLWRGFCEWMGWFQ